MTEGTFAIARLTGKTDNRPRLQAVTWLQFVELFRVPRRTRCTVEDCKHADCAHKNGAAWSPTLYDGNGRKDVNVDSITLASIDCDHVADDDIPEIEYRTNGYRRVLHATHSDRRGDRAVRVVLALSRALKRGEHRAFWPRLVEMLALPGVDSSKRNESALYFLPSRPGDADYYFLDSDGDAVDVDAVLARPEPASTTSREQKTSSSTNAGKKPGERHAALTKLAGAMRRHGADAATILEALRAYNAKECDPPKPDAELIEIAGYVGKKQSQVALAGGAVKMAADYVEKFGTHGGIVAIRRWRGDWYRWMPDRGHYVPVSDERIEASLYRDLNLSRRADVGDVRHAMIAVPDVLSDEAELGSWLDGTKTDPNEIAVCANGLLHLQTMRLTPATPRYFSTSALGVCYSPDSPEPKLWKAFLKQLWLDDPQSIETLQEFIGYLLTPDTRQQKILGLIGKSRSGKGTIARVKSSLLGTGNIVSPTLAQFGNNFGLTPLVGKSAAIIQDARLSGKTDVAQVVERLLSISGEDEQTIDRKFREAWTGKLSTRIVLVSNELPRLTDASDALANRMLILELAQSFLGREDTELTDKLKAELPGILLWAIDGWKRLRARGRFVQPESSKDAIDDMMDLASPVGAWVRRDCVTDCDDREYWLEPSFAYSKFLAWCETAGIKVPPTLAQFGRDVKTITGAKRVQVPRGTRPVVWVYRGLAIRPS